MSLLNRDIFKYYTVFRSTGLIESDIKSLKKINNLIYKYLNTDIDRYKHEAINILKTAINMVNPVPEYFDLLRNKIIEEDKHLIFNGFVEEVIDG